MRYLDLSSNPWETLSDKLGSLSQLETLIALNCALIRIPTAVTNLSKLQQFDLSYNQITEIPESLAQLSSLQQLDLSYNQITEIPESLVQLSSLQQLNLSYNQITEIPESLAQLSSLQQLDFSYNQITEISESLAQLSFLQQLNLSYNQITEIQSLAQLSSLQQLDLSSNQITEIPESLAQLSFLQQLNLSYNQVSVIPESLAQLSFLQQLNLSYNQITEIPESLAQLSSLQQLDFSSNQITKIPESLAQLSSLQQLDFSYNQISVIPEPLAQLSSLQHLDLSSNQISAISEPLAQLSSLQQLNLNYNQISVIPESLAQLSSLQQLDFSSNQITEIPESLAQLSSLQQLDFSSNQITEIPESLAQLSSLQQLDLSSNQITGIPEPLAQLSSLQQLNLSYNQITEIPESLAQLSSLQQLNFNSNQITEIPESLEGLMQLKKLDVRCNSLPISPEILGPPQLHYPPGAVSGIFNYCRQLRSSDVQPLNEAKLILVGQGSVGKTSLINRLINDYFNPNEAQTDGLNVISWMINVNTKNVRLNVWDFGGQEIYHATHQFFLTKRSLYLLVCNCRTSEDENRLDYWLKLIQSFGDQSPVIIVGNKRDEQPLDINRKALREKYSNIKDIIETSCQTGDGLKELNQVIHREVGQLKEVYDLLPLSWFEVKEQLEAMEKDFVSYTEYIGICYQNDIPDEPNQTQLIDLLHNLGLVLNYREHPLLQNTNVLNPDWVTQGIYTLLSDDDLKTQAKGQLTLADLNRILPVERYPKNRHNYLIELMKEFQLCFQLPECIPDRYLIPGILPKEEPEETDLKGETLDFQYHYAILPDSVISRFIVLMYDKIYKQLYWRSGVMLIYGEGDNANVARIRSDPADNKIFIAISGNQSTRREFLAIIRDVFNRIHASFTQPTEWVPVPEHPEHPPLDYQELLGLEVMGVSEYPIGKLRITVNLHQLLDGYESFTSRQQLRQSQKDINNADSLYTDDSDIDEEFQIDIFSIK
uniref:leucine-rich repeat protein n=1 Tax=Leptothoe spongobia TaxID=2651728 RepID=UPI00248488D1